MVGFRLLPKMIVLVTLFQLQQGTESSFHPMRRLQSSQESASMAELATTPTAVSLPPAPTVTLSGASRQPIEAPSHDSVNLTAKNNTSNFKYSTPIRWAIAVPIISLLVLIITLGKNRRCICCQRSISVDSGPEVLVAAVNSSGAIELVSVGTHETDWTGSSSTVDTLSFRAFEQEEEEGIFFQ